jgi:hypothetical protein
MMQMQYQRASELSDEKLTGDGNQSVEDAVDGLAISG